MRFWTREIMGWMLLLLGLFIFYSCFVMLATERPPRLLEAAPLTLIGIIVFRGGIQLLRVAVAAASHSAPAACLSARRTRSPAARSPARATARSRRVGA